MTQGPNRDEALAALATNLSALIDLTARRTARLFAREEMLSLRLRSRRYAAYGKLFDSLARFGGGSLLTAVLVLIFSGHVDAGVVATALATLLAFLGGTIFTLYFEQHAASVDYLAERLDAVLKEVER